MGNKCLGAFCLGLVACQWGSAEDWSQWMGNNRDGVWNEKGLVDMFPPGGPPVKWRVSMGGGYSGPAVVGDTVFLMDRVLDAGVNEAANPFLKSTSRGNERVIGLDRATGKVKWAHSYPVQYLMQYPCGPRCTPTVDKGQVFALGAMGDLVVLDATTGKLQWKRSFPAEFGSKIPVWGFASHPLVVGNLVVTLVGEKDGKSVVMAFNRLDGRVAWKALSLENPQNDIGYCPPTLIDHGGRKILVVWHPEAVCGLVPETGKSLWEVPFKVKASLSVPTPRYQNGNILVSSFYNGSMLLKLSPSGETAEVVWKGKGRGETPAQTDGLHSIMSTPFIDGEFFYGVCSYGELRGLRLADGARMWASMKATGEAGEPVERWANAFLVRNGDKTVVFNEKGDLIIARLSPNGYQEMSRAKVINPTGVAPAGGVNRKIVWSHPAFAHRCVFVRNDKELICLSMARE